VPDVFTSVHQFRGAGTDMATAAMFSPSTGVPPLLWCSVVCRSVPGWLVRQHYHMQPCAVRASPLKAHPRMDSRAARELSKQRVCDAGSHPRVVLYNDVLKGLRLLMIERMVKPEEVLLTVDEHGNVVRDIFRDTDSLQQYKTMRETLVYLSHLDYANTEEQMLEKLRLQLAGQLHWDSLNTLCWVWLAFFAGVPERPECHAHSALCNEVQTVSDTAWRVRLFLDALPVGGASGALVPCRFAMHGESAVCSACVHACRQSGPYLGRWGRGKRTNSL
jgi:hypothetical protein